MDRIQILATLNESYLPRLEVLLTSIFINQLRLGTDHNYYNSGVLLMDLDRGREEIIAGDPNRGRPGIFTGSEFCTNITWH